jgi:hypothetical protein
MFPSADPYLRQFARMPAQTDRIWIVAAISAFCFFGCGRRGEGEQPPTVTHRIVLPRTIGIGMDKYQLRPLEESVPVDLSCAELYARSDQDGEIYEFPREEYEGIARCLGQINGARMIVQAVTLEFGDRLVAQASCRFDASEGFPMPCSVELRKENSGDWCIVDVAAVFY